MKRPVIHLYFRVSILESEFEQLNLNYITCLPLPISVLYSTCIITWRTIINVVRTGGAIHLSVLLGNSMFRYAK